MVTKSAWICGVLLALLLAGCSRQHPGGGDAGNHTIALQCGDVTPLELRVVGNVYVDSREFGSSNCSVHAAHGIVTVRCPPAELSVSPSAR